MLYIIGLGLNKNGISKQGMLALEKCHKIYLENYTSDFPYELEDLHLGKKIIPIERKDVESNKLIKEARGRNIGLLVYGCPLFATTHISLIIDAEKQGVNSNVIYSASVFDAVAETGLQLYKFGKITTMPNFNTSPKSDFLQYVKENQSIKAHSLILIDIGLSFRDALTQLIVKAEEKKIKLDKIIVCSNLGNEKSEVFYSDINELKEKDDEVQAPFCFIIPSELHFLEKEGIERFG